jgi:transposase
MAERKGRPPEFIARRMQAVMKVSLGLSSVRDAARDLGVSAKHYYRLQERMIRGFVDGLRLRKRGPKPTPEQEARLEGLQRNLVEAARDRELLQLRVASLEEALEFLRSTAAPPKKKAGGPRHPRKRPPVRGRGPAADARLRRAAAVGGNSGGARLPGPGDRAVDVLPMEERKGRPGRSSGS